MICSFAFTYTGNVKMDKIVSAVGAAVAPHYSFSYLVILVLFCTVDYFLILIFQALLENALFLAFHFFFVMHRC